MIVCGLACITLLSACDSVPTIPLGPLTHDVYWLADDARAGRLPGTPGAEAAADYLEKNFRDAGLSPAFGDSYRQSFDARPALERPATLPSTTASTTPSTAPAANGVVRAVRAENVAAILPGRGPHADEFVVIGAHYDHIGLGKFASRKPESAQIHNGADDNASGTAAMLAAARELSHGKRLARSVLFVGFSAEESGLIGSNYFVAHSPVPVEKIVAMINLDMVGRVRNDTLFVGGGGTRPAFTRLLEQADEASPLNFKSIGQGGMGPSDHMSFAMKKIPVLFFFSGLHNQYHHPDDDAPLVNYKGLSQVAGVTVALTRKLTDLPREAYVDRFDGQWMNAQTDVIGTTRPSTQSSHTGRASLGVIPDYGSDLAAGGVRIGGTVPNSPAAGAGLIAGDVLIGFDASPINNLYDLTDLLAKAEPGKVVVIKFLRGQQTKSASVTLVARRQQ